ncbi:acyltransferase family protein [Terrabacter sp. AAH1]
MNDADPARVRVGGLDGLRGLAILLVLLAHTVGLEGAGMVGVLIFFVLSGYLITSLLLAEGRALGRVDLPVFYLRRAARLVPALIAFLVVFVAAIFLVQGVAAVGGLVPGLVQALLYVTDLTLGLQGNYRPELAHLWSLAVEEQFYLIWPVCLVFWMKAPAGTRLRRVITATAFFVAVRAATWALAPSLGLFVYALPTTWVDVLLVGAICGLVKREHPAVWLRLKQVNRRHLSGVGLVVSTALEN